MNRGALSFLVIVVAIGTSIVTVLLSENLRSSNAREAASTEPRPPEPSAQPAPPEIQASAPRQEREAITRLAGLEQRLANLEARLDALGQRQPLAAGIPESGSPAWREEVLALLDEALAQREDEARKEAEEEAEAARERDLRLQISLMRDEYDLGPSEEASLLDLMREVSRRMQELDEMRQAPDADPGELTRRLSEFETWQRDEATRVLGLSRTEEIFGH